MSEAIMKVEQWVEVFRATGLDDRQMELWHAEFERRYPEGHQGFLEWLALSPERIELSGIFLVLERLALRDSR